MRFLGGITVRITSASMDGAPALKVSSFAAGTLRADRTGGVINLPEQEAASERCDKHASYDQMISCDGFVWTPEQSSSDND